MGARLWARVARDVVRPRAARRPGAAPAPCLRRARGGVDRPSGRKPSAVAFGAVALARALRGVVHAQRLLPRALLTFGNRVGCQLWLALAHLARLRDEALAALGSAPELATASVIADAARAAAATAAFVLVFGGALAYLPGLTPLWRERPWQVGASSR